MSSLPSGLKLTWAIKAWFWTTILCFVGGASAIIVTVYLVFTMKDKYYYDLLCASLLCFSYTFGLLAQFCMVKARLKTRDLIKNAILLFQRDLNSNLESSIRIKISQTIADLERLLQRIENGLKQKRF